VAPSTVVYRHWRGWQRPGQKLPRQCKNTRGLFAEVCRIPANLKFRLAAVPGVQSAKSLAAHTIQREHRGKPFRMFVQGLDWPEDKGVLLCVIGAARD
jgi:hypothetical protein